MTSTENLTKNSTGNIDGRALGTFNTEGLYLVGMLEVLKYLFPGNIYLFKINNRYAKKCLKYV